VTTVESVVVATMPGSLPMGGVVRDTPIHALLPSPPALAFPPRPELRPRRTDIDLGGPLAFHIERVVTADEADLIVAISERLGYRDEAPGIQTAPGMRMNKSVHWVGDAAFLGAIHARIAHLLPQELDGQALHGRFSQRINMYKYDQDDVFNRHTDGDWPGFGLSDDGRRMVEWSGLRSKLTMLLYLNGPADGVEGGNTRLFLRRGGAVDVTPEKGAALFFRHGFERSSVPHEGTVVKGPVPKYVARINVLYEDG
jgi:hypothetical protein